MYAKHFITFLLLFFLVILVDPKSSEQNFLTNFGVFTGFRNKDYEYAIISAGGKIITAISKSTYFLIIKDKNEKSSKIDKANKYVVSIMKKEELEKLL